MTLTRVLSFGCGLALVVAAPALAAPETASGVVLPPGASFVRIAIRDAADREDAAGATFDVRGSSVVLRLDHGVTARVRCKVREDVAGLISTTLRVRSSAGAPAREEHLVAPSGVAEWTMEHAGQTYDVLVRPTVGPASVALLRSSGRAP